MRRVNQFENNSVAPGRINNVEMSNGSSRFWDGVARLTDAYSRMHMETAEKKYLAGLDLLKSQEINRLEQENPNDPDALKEQLAASKNAIADSINSDEIRNHFETGFDMQSITPVNRAMAGKQAILDDEFTTTLHADIAAQRDMSMKLIPDVIKGDPSALINIKNAFAQIGEMFNATHADGRAVFSPETRANALLRLKDDFYSDYVVAAVKNSKNPAQAIKQFKNGTVALDFPNDDGSFENVNVREAMSYEAVQRVDGALDAYMKQLEAEARMRRLELASKFNDLATAARISGDVAPLYRLADAVGGKEGIEIRQNTDIIKAGIDTANDLDGLTSWPDKYAYLAERENELNAIAAAAAQDPDKAAGLSYKQAIYQEARSLTDKRYQEALKDQAGYAQKLLNQRFNAVNAAAGVEGVNLPTLSEGSIGANLEAQRMIFGENAVRGFISAEQKEQIGKAYSQAEDTRAHFEITRKIAQGTGAYSTSVLQEIGLRPADAFLVNTANIDKTAYDEMVDLYAAGSLKNGDVPANADFKQSDFDSAWGKSNTLNAFSSMSAALPANTQLQGMVSDMQKSFKRQAQITDSTEGYKALDKYYNAIETSDKILLVPKNIGVTSREVNHFLDEQKENQRTALIEHYKLVSPYDAPGLTNQYAENRVNDLIWLSDYTNPANYYLADPVDQRAVILPDGNTIETNANKLMEQANLRRANMPKFNVSYAPGLGLVKVQGE